MPDGSIWDGVAAVTTDTELSEESDNPVANRVITTALDNVDDKISNIKKLTSDSREGETSISAVPIDADKLGGIDASEYVMKSDLEEINGLPAGGTVGQVLMKASDTDQDVEWKDLSDGLHMKLLWENASKTSTFGEQTINIDLSEYDFVMIEFGSNSDINESHNDFIRVGCNSALRLTGGWSNKAGHRNVTCSASSVYFNICYYGSSEDNSNMVPFRIYGIKGVTF